MTMMMTASIIPKTIIFFLFMKRTPLLILNVQIKKSGMTGCRSSYYNAILIVIILSSLISLSFQVLYHTHIKTWGIEEGCIIKELVAHIHM